MLDAQLEILVLEAQSGNQAAMARLYQHFYVPMRKYAVLRVSDVMVADDLVQNVWLKVARRLRSLDDASLIRSWLYKALRWEILDWQRKAGKEVITDNVAEDSTYDVSKTEDASTLGLLKKLAPAERDIAQLFYLSDLSVREISLITGIAQGTVKSRLSRAREQLKQLIES